MSCTSTMPGSDLTAARSRGSTRKPPGSVISTSLDGRSRTTVTRPRPPTASRWKSPLRRGTAPPAPAKTLNPRRGVRHPLIQRLDLLCGEPETLLLAPDIDGDDQRLPAIEERPRRRQHVGEHGDLEDAAHVRQRDEREAVAACGGPLLLADDDAGEPKARRRMRRERRRQVGEGQDAGALQAFAVRVERVARQVKADRVELVLQFLDRRPILDDRQLGTLGKPAVDAAEKALLLADALLRGKAR